MSIIFQHSDESPFHISVGAVLVNDEGKILVHKMTKETIPTDRVHALGNLEQVYILMRESLENDETLEYAVARGLAEEFGMEGALKKYLGSIQIIIEDPERTFEKTTLYFEVALTKINERPQHDAESHSTLEWVEPETLIEKMKEQGRSSSRTDIDESKIIEAYVRYK